MAHASRSDLEQALAALRNQYEVLVEAAPEALMIFDADVGRFETVNRRACELFEATSEQLRNASPADLSPPTQPDGSDSAARLNELLGRALAGEVIELDWVHWSVLSGEPRPVRVNVCRVSTERKLVRASLQDQRETRRREQERGRLLAILEATPDTVGMAEVDGQTLYLNRAGRRLLGVLPNEDVTGRPIASFHTATAAIRLRNETLPAAMANGSWTGESELVGSDGAAIPVSQVLIAHRDDNGNVAFFSSILRDLRDRVAAEELSRRVLHGQKLESLGVMAGGLAHDLNNILVAVLANASLLEAVVPPGEAAEMARDVTFAAGRAGELARAMLDYSGRAPRLIALVDIADAVEASRRLFVATASKDVALVVDVPADTPPAWADPGQVRQVLLNLLLNAADASAGLGPRTVTVRAGGFGFGEEAGQIVDHRINGGPTGGFVLVEVVDAGRGIAAEVLPRIFDPFFSTKQHGRGLGLASVVGIVKAHGGAVAVRTSEHGTTVQVLLPSAAGSEVATPVAVPVAQRIGTGLVLLVDDEPAVRGAARRCLSQLGFDAVEAADGEAGLKRFLAEPEAFAAALVDVTMPRMDGISLMKHLVALRPDLPVVLCSGYPPPELPGPPAHVTFLGKPFSVRDLQLALDQVLVPTALGRS